MGKQNAEEKIRPVSNWPNSARLKMVERSKYYDGSGKIYQYGYYDGYMEALTLKDEEFNLKLKEIRMNLFNMRDHFRTRQIDSINYNNKAKGLETAIKILDTYINKGE